jgi:hypothetical protein
MVRAGNSKSLNTMMSLESGWGRKNINAIRIENGPKYKYVRRASEFELAGACKRKQIGV